MSTQDFYDLQNALLMVRQECAEKQDNADRLQKGRDPQDSQHSLITFACRAQRSEGEVSAADEMYIPLRCRVLRWFLTSCLQRVLLAKGWHRVWQTR